MDDLIKHLEDMIKLQNIMFEKMFPGISFPHDLMCNRAGYKQAIIDIEQFLKQKTEKKKRKN